MQERPDRVVLHPPLPETRCALHQVSLTWRQPDRHATTTTENHMVVIVPDRRDFRGDVEKWSETTRHVGRLVAMACGFRLSGDSVRRTILVIAAAPCLTPAT